MENLYQGKNSKKLDPRGVFIIQAKEEMRVWLGSQVPPTNLLEYKKCAEHYIKILQKYERAASSWSYVE